MNQLIIKGIKRVNEFGDPELIGQDEATQLDNLVLDKEAGKPYRRGAFTRFDTSNNAGGQLESLHDVTDGTNDYLIGVVGTAVKKSQNGTSAWSNLKTGLTSGQKTRIAKFIDQYVITNGSNVPFITNITSVWDLDIDRPDLQSLSIGTSVGGDLTASALYRYILVYVTEDGNYSDISFPFTYVTGAVDIDSTDASNKTIDFTSLPTSGDSRVTGRRLFRTKADSDVYYLCASLNNSDTSYSDDKADTDLDTNYRIELQAPITKAKYPLYHKARLFLANHSRTARNIIMPPAHIPFTCTQGDNGSAGIDDGTYKYKMSYLDSQGRESELSTYVQVTVDHITGSFTDGNGQITISSIPRPRYGAGAVLPDIAKIRIYRTQASGSTYYWIKDVGVTTTATTDSTNDTGLTTTYPKSGTGGSNENDYPNGIVWSDIDKVNTFPVLNLLQVFPDDGDEITGIVDEQDGILVFKKNSIRKVYTQGNSASWRIVTITESIGCDQPNTLAVSPMGVYFVNHNKVFRYTNGSYEEIGITLRNTLNSVSVFDGSAYFNKRNWYVMACDDEVYVYDEKVQSWYVFTSGDMGTVDCVVEKKLGSARGTLLLGGNSGYPLKYDETANLDFEKTTATETEPVVPILKTKVFVFPDANAKFRLRKLFANYKKTDNKAVTHYLEEYSKGSSMYNSDSTNSSYTSDYKDYEKDTANFTSEWKEGEKLTYKATGAGLEQFNSARIMYHEVNKGSRV